MVGYRQSNGKVDRTQKQSKQVDVVCIGVYNGIVQVIEPNGNVGYYRMRNINKLNRVEITNLIGAGVLDKHVLELLELPKEYHCSFEKNSGMGRCVVNFDKRKYGM